MQVDQTSGTADWGRWSREQREQMRENLKSSSYYIEVTQAKEQGCQLIITPSKFHKAPFLSTRPITVLLHILLSGWRNLADGLHFQHLGVSKAEARRLHQQASYYDVLEPLSKKGWYYMEPVTAARYKSARPTGTEGNRQWAGGVCGGVIVYLSSKELEYGLFRVRDSTALYKAAPNLLSGAYQVETGLSRCLLNCEQEWCITYQQARFGDYLREGMVWEFFPQGSLCPICDAIESGRVISHHSDYKAIVSTPYEEVGLAEDITLFECEVCQVRWEVDKSRNHWDYGYP